MKIARIGLLVFSIAVAAAGPVGAETFRGQGNAMIISGDQSAAEKLAAQSALRKAVSEAIESIIPTGSPDRLKYNANKGELMRQDHPFIKNRRVAARNLKGRQLTVEMEIDVDLDALRGFLGRQGILATQATVMKKQEFPPVAVILAEEISGNVNSIPYSEQVIRQALIDEGFDVIDDKLARKSNKHDQAVQALLNNDLNAARAVALQYDAGVVITGKAVAQKSGTQSGGMTVQGADITLEAARTDSGKVLATASAEGHFPHVNAMTGSRKAIEEASARAAKELLRNLKVSFETTTQTVVVTVSGINFKQLAIVKKILQRDFPQITSIKQNAFNGRVAKLDVAVGGPVVEWLDQLALHDFGTFRLEVINYSSGKVDLVIKLKAAGN